MKIKCFHSSSKGNLYSISDGVTEIMIECGVSFKEIQKCFKHRLSRLGCCLITHEHGDHSRSWEKVMRYTPVYMLPETAEALGAKGYNLAFYTPDVRLNIGTFNILPIKAAHDVPCCYFIIKSKATGEKLLFATDTAYLPIIDRNVHYAMIECNYTLESLNREVDMGRLHPAMRNRIIKSHMGWQTTEDIIRSLNLNLLKEIHILHLSNRHGDAEKIFENVISITGTLVYIADE